ncbi:hypothetical protein BKA83DRAFT_4122672 [Pisolithus microcarpus]|nr:hypothetical protein BKA83DRAFT_4122672 [Pisolithus microcarpus]
MPVPPPDNMSPVPAVSHDVRTVVLAVAHDEQCKNIVWGTIGTIERVRHSCFLRCSGDMVQGVAARFLVTDPTQVAEASMSSTLMTRLVLQIKHVDDEVRISPPSPPFLLLAVHERSMPPIKHIDDEVIISMHERSMLLIKHVSDEVIILQIKHVDSEVIVPMFGFPLLLLPALQRSAAQIKHIDDEVNIADQACR